MEEEYPRFPSRYSFRSSAPSACTGPKYLNTWENEQVLDHVLIM